MQSCESLTFCTDAVWETEIEEKSIISFPLSTLARFWDLGTLYEMVNYWAQIKMKQLSDLILNTSQDSLSLFIDKL